MSASLVGSEMCIRDRCSEPAADRADVKRTESRDHARARARPSSHERGAVSYTHLTLPTICSV
eukprot:13919024-Alexandrium_andersonii.AAC.1